MPWRKRRFKIKTHAIERRLARDYTVKDLGDELCWICFLPTLNTKNDAVGLRTSVDHNPGALKLAHAWCNSRRGAADHKLNFDVRYECFLHMRMNYPKFFTPDQLAIAADNLITLGEKLRK